MTNSIKKHLISKNMRNFLKILLCLCVCIGIYQTYLIKHREASLIEAHNEMMRIEAEMEALKLECENKTSTSAVVSLCVESFINGLTLGMFDEDGVFGTSRRLDRWEQSIIARATDLESRYNITQECIKRNQINNTFRNIACVLSIIIILILVSFNDSKKNVAR